MSKLSDFPEWADFFLLEDIKTDPRAEQKFLSQDHSREFKLFVERLEGLKQFEKAEIEKGFRDLVSELGIDTKALIHPVRVALTGKTIGPGLFEIIYHLGKERVKKRLLKWAERSQA